MDDPRNPPENPQENVYPEICRASTFEGYRHGRDEYGQKVQQDVLRCKADVENYYVIVPSHLALPPIG